MGGNVGFADATGIRAGRVEKSAAGTRGAVDDLFGENEKIVGVVVVLFADHVDESCPTVAKADDLIAFVERANRDAANRGIQTGDITASGENADDALLGVDVGHALSPFRGELNQQLSMRGANLERAERVNFCEIEYAAEVA